MVARKLTYEEVKQFIESGSNYKLLSTKYVNNKTKLLIRCDNNHEFLLNFNSFKEGIRCKECYYDKIRERTELAKNEKIKEINAYCHKEGYLVDTSNYKDNKQYLNFICPKGHEFKMKWNSFINGNRCKHCFNEIKGNLYRKSKKEIITIIEDMGYTLIDGNYINNKTKLKFSCKIGHVFEKSFNGLMQHKECPECNENYQRWNITKVKEFVEKDGYFLISSKYINANSKLVFKCPKEHIFKTKWANFYWQGHRCPVCNESKGEKRIRGFLENNNVKFIAQYEFPDLLGINGGNLKFDFAVLDDKNTLFFLIEYDGKFHYEKMYDEDGHDTLIIHDGIKNKYCDKNKLKLIRIPYWEFDNIEEILNIELEKVI